ncbi:hypothetical protein [Caminibacter sp.]
MNLPLRDIKPNVEIIDYGWWFFVVFLVILSIVLLFLIYKWLKNRKKNPALIMLKNLDFSNSKKTAYIFSKYAKEFVNETNKELFEEIEKKLVKFKYKPDVPEMDEKLIEKIKAFIRTLK